MNELHLYEQLKAIIKEIIFFQERTRQLGLDREFFNRQFRIVQDMISCFKEPQVVTRSFQIVGSTSSTFPYEQVLKEISINSKYNHKTKVPNFCSLVFLTIIKESLLSN